MKTVNFNGWNCLVNKASYGNGRTALKLIDAEDGCSVAVATVNIPECPCSEDEVFIKDYSENSGILKCLTEAGIIGKPIREIKTGFVTIPVCKILI